MLEREAFFFDAASTRATSCQRNHAANSGYFSLHRAVYQTTLTPRQRESANLSQEDLINSTARERISLDSPFDTRYYYYSTKRTVRYEHS